MKRGNKKVDQVTKEGLLIEDYDISLTPKEISAVLMKYFTGLVEAEGSSPTFYLGEYKGHKYAIRCKNVTYLGNPHPVYKKRIQIADDLFKFYNAAVAMGREPLLLGIYTYGDNTVFVNFGLETYIEKKAHNSSAHIYSSDLSVATEEGYFEKVDFFGNTVKAFRPDVVEVFLDEIFETKDDYLKVSVDEPIEIDDRTVYSTAPVILEEQKSDARASAQRALTYHEILTGKIVPEIKTFFIQEPKRWYGIDCYKKMIAEEYKNKYQPEWVGFFLEYEFEKYLTENDLLGIIQYYQDKTDGGIDLDLYFPPIQSYGDLKAHSEESRGIQGNDWGTVFSIINGRRPEDHIYYIVCEHATEKDELYDYEVTKFWNTSQHKENLLSYHKRMKNNVTLKRVYILDINYSNREYLTMFKQGLNSNGKPRAPKIMIEQDNLKYFVIDELKL